MIGILVRIIKFGIAIVKYIDKILEIFIVDNMA